MVLKINPLQFPQGWWMSDHHILEHLQGLTWRQIYQLN